MKKIFVFISLLLSFASSTYADDAFSVGNVTLPKNGEADVVVKFSLDEGSTCSGYTFWLQVPEQLAFLTYVKNEKTYVTYTAGDCYDDTPTITPNIDDGYLKVGCLTANSDPIIGQTGTLVTFQLKVVGEVNVGDVLNGKLVRGTISAEKGTVHDVADANFTITIGEPTDTRTVLDENSTTAPAAASDVDVRVKRTINAGVWNTICLPFAMTEAQIKEAFGNDVQLADFTGYQATEDYDRNVVGITVSFEPVNAIEANHPYIIKVSSPVTEFTVDGVDIDPEEEPTKAAVKRTKKQWSEMIGTYVAEKTIEDQMLFLNGGSFWYSTGKTKMKGYRAYFDFYDVLTDVEGAGVRLFLDLSGKETGIGEILTSDTQGAIYDLSGRKVVKPQLHGVYIINGKKVMK